MWLSWAEVRTSNSLLFMESLNQANTVKSAVPRMFSPCVFLSIPLQTASYLRELDFQTKLGPRSPFCIFELRCCFCIERTRLAEMVTGPWVPSKARAAQVTCFCYSYKSYLLHLYAISGSWECSVSLCLSLSGYSCMDRRFISPEYISKR